VQRDQDVVNGDYIFLDQRTEFFSVSTSKSAAPAQTPPRHRGAAAENARGRCRESRDRTALPTAAAAK
jgi:hypothetical protein